MNNDFVHDECPRRSGGQAGAHDALVPGEIAEHFPHVTATLAQQVGDLPCLPRSHLDDHFAAAAEMRTNFPRYPPVEFQTVLAS